MKNRIKLFIIKVFGKQTFRVLQFFLHLPGSILRSLLIGLKTIVKWFSMQIHTLSKNVSWRRKANKLAQLPGGLQLNLGCGNTHFEGMLNCEIRPTKAADIIMDCSNLSRFEDASVRLIYSHAVFEHMYRDKQIPLLKDCLRVLREDGLLAFLGIPDFEVVAKSYLDGVPGISDYGETFDLYHVYRNTHGDPEMAKDYWLAQLHKSLFDKKSIIRLLTTAGFTYATIFNYCNPGENIPMNAGFFAWRKEPELSFDQTRKLIPDLPTGKMGEVLIYLNGKLRKQ